MIIEHKKKTTLNEIKSKHDKNQEYKEDEDVQLWTKRHKDETKWAGQTNE